jgi:hypothetical protein
MLKPPKEAVLIVLDRRTHVIRQQNPVYQFDYVRDAIVQQQLVAECFVLFDQPFSLGVVTRMHYC